MLPEPHNNSMIAMGSTSVHAINYFLQIPVHAL